MFLFLQKVMKSLLLVGALALTTLTQAAEPIKLALIEGLSGPFANTGEAVFRNLLWATERVNAAGGVKLAGQAQASALLL